MFNPKNVFEASDYMIDRLALLFEKERKKEWIKNRLNLK
jgi:hypothetical protein